MGMILAFAGNSSPSVSSSLFPREAWECTSGRSASCVRRVMGRTETRGVGRGLLVPISRLTRRHHQKKRRRSHSSASNVRTKPIVRPPPRRRHCPTGWSTFSSQSFNQPPILPPGPSGASAPAGASDGQRSASTAVQGTKISQPSERSDQRSQLRRNIKRTRTANQPRRNTYTAAPNDWRNSEAISPPSAPSRFVLVAGDAPAKFESITLSVRKTPPRKSRQTERYRRQWRRSGIRRNSSCVLRRRQRSSPPDGKLALRIFSPSEKGAGFIRKKRVIKGRFNSQTTKDAFFWTDGHSLGMDTMRPQPAPERGSRFVFAPAWRLARAPAVD